ncbi:MAG: hypothetical protein HBSAPP03_07290 [Phycisphaerae bacterium]|nr:MAG: hypothetical protein HBSAPP03_07290 [Phycisphaerae bacterium]
MLVAVAAPKEAAAALRGLGLEGTPGLWEVVRGGEGVDVVMTGVGKANAAGCVARAVAPGAYAAVLSVGIAGALPGGPAVGAVVVGTRSEFADEGVMTPAGFEDLARVGFPVVDGGMGVEMDGWVADALRGVEGVRGVIACVSACSGTDAQAAEMVRRTGAVAEAMEGAAVGLVARRIGVGFGEVRVISNQTGARERQGWDLRGALEVMARVIGPGVRAVADAAP